MTSSDSSLQTLSESSRNRGETYDSLAPLTGVPLPSCIPRGDNPFGGGLDLMGSEGVDSLSSSPLVPSSHLSKRILRCLNPTPRLTVPGDMWVVLWIWINFPSFVLLGMDIP